MTPAGDWDPAAPVLREYALIADGERGALVGPHGQVAWLCAPHWDSDPVFCGLLGGRSQYRVAPSGRCVWGGYYEDGSLVWRSRWTTDDGTVVESRDALALPGDPHRVVVLRRVRVLAGAARVRVRLDLRADADRHRLTHLHRGPDGTWTARAGALQVRWQAGPAAAVVADDGSSVLGVDLDLRAGQVHDLVLEVSDRPLPEAPAADLLWRGTEEGWRERVPELAGTWSPHHARHSLAVLHGLTAGSGAMVAAATTSLPERADQGRDYDYRFAWVRDQCYAGHAAFAAGHPALADRAVRFLTERLLDDGPQLAPAYTTRGGPIPTPRPLHLPGYPGGGARVGNQVRTQFQLDAVGEALHLLATAQQQDRLDDEGRRAAQTAVTTIAQRWQEPDAGIWELQARWWTQSRFAAIAGLRAWAASSAGGGARAAGAHGEDVLALADTMMAAVATRASHPSGRWQRAEDDERVDAALLLSTLRAVVPPDDPRSLATLAAVQQDLGSRGHVYRFRQDARPLEDAEGAFLLCDYWTAMVEAQTGQGLRAVARLERALAACGPPGLFSEEYDVVQRQMRGNLPQAFVHALALEACARMPHLVGAD